MIAPRIIFSLACAFCVSLSVARAEGLQVSSISGEAWVSKNDQWVPLAPGDYVSEGAWVSTTDGSGAELVDSAGAVLRAGSDTLMAVSGDGALHLWQGGALVTGQSRAIVTPEGSFNVSGEAVALSMQNGFRALNLAGDGALTFADGEQVSLEAGQLASTAPGGAAGPVVDVDLAAAVKSSFLVNGFNTRLPVMAQVERAASQQAERVERGQMIHSGYRAVTAASETQMALTHVGQQARMQATDFQQAIRRERVAQEQHIEQQRLAQQQQRTRELASQQELARQRAQEAAIAKSTGGTLTLSSNSVIDMGAGDVGLQFTNSLLSGGTLNIHNWTGGLTQSLAPSGFNNLVSENILFYSDSGSSLISSGYFGYGSVELLPVGSADLGDWANSGYQIVTINTDGQVSKSYTSIAFNGGSGVISEGMLESDNHYDSPMVLRSAQDLTIVDVDIFAREVRMTAQESLSVVNTRFTDYNTQPIDIAMSARTIALQDVDFPSGSRVSLSSEVGRLAENPNTNRPVQTGYVNFVQNVTYGQQPAQDFVDSAVGGAGSFGGQGPIAIQQR